MHASEGALRLTQKGAQVAARRRVDSRRHFRARTRLPVRQSRDAAQRRTKMPSTVGTKFKEQLKSLNKELLATDPHYVRCIKSNSLKQP